MKKSIFIMMALFANSVLMASDIKVGLSADPPSYKIYSTDMNIGVQVGDALAYKAELPMIFMEESAAPMDEETFKWGIAMAFVLANIGGDFTDDNSFRGTFMFGVFAMYALTTQLYLLPSLYYIGLGTSFSDSSFDVSLRLAYLMLPILVMYAITEQWKVGLGPYFGFLLSAKNKGDGVDQDVKDFVSGFDFGIKIAVMYKVSEYLSLSLGYLHGVTNLSDNNSSESFKQYNRAIMFAAYINLMALINR